MYTVYLFTHEGEGGGELNQRGREKVRGTTVHKAGSKSLPRMNSSFRISFSPTTILDRGKELASDAMGVRGLIHQKARLQPYGFEIGQHIC